MRRLARLALSLFFILPLAAQSSLEEMLGGIRDYLLKLPVKDGRLGPHPALLEEDRCEAAKPREVVVLLSYRQLNCAAYPGALVIAPKLIHPEKRERIRRMGFPFALAPLGFELASYQAAQKRYKMPVRLEPPIEHLYGAVDKPRPQENAFGISIRRHDESVVERVTRDVSRIEQHLLGLVAGAETRRATAMRTAGAREVARRWHQEVVGSLPAYQGPFRLRERTVAEGAEWTGLSISIDALPGVIAQGVLLRPKKLKEFERRPLVIVQHGLMGRPESLFGQSMESK
ncbi:MAG: hypothetical protein ABIQ44_03595, partial [Chloroflexia bacterium]